MSLWIELHCDVRIAAGWPNSTSDDLVCYSAKNQHVMGMTGNDGRGAMSHIRHLKRTARHGGWAYNQTLQQWICPGCQKWRVDQLKKPK